MKPSIEILKLKHTQNKKNKKKQKTKTKTNKQKNKQIVLLVKNCNNKMKKLLDEGTLLPPPSSDYTILSNYLLGILQIL